MGQLADITEAVKDDLILGLAEDAFTLTFVPIRLWRPLSDPEQLQKLTVSCVPAALATEALSRSEDLIHYSVHVLVQCRINDEKNLTADPYDTLADEIMDFFRLRSLESYTTCNAGVESVQRPVAVSYDHLDQFRVFTTYVELTIAVGRAAS